MTKIITESIQKIIDEIKKKDGILEVDGDHIRFNGEFKEFVETLEIIHNLDDIVKKGKKKEKSSPYRLQRIVLMFVNDKGESKRTLIKEIAEPQPVEK